MGPIPWFKTEYLVLIYFTNIVFLSQVLSRARVSQQGRFLKITSVLRIYFMLWCHKCHDMYFHCFVFLLGRCSPNSPLLWWLLYVGHVVSQLATKGHGCFDWTASLLVKQKFSHHMGDILFSIFRFERKTKRRHSGKINKSSYKCWTPRWYFMEAFWIFYYAFIFNTFTS